MLKQFFWLIACLLSQVSAWGRDGHCIIADIAQSLLTEEAKAGALQLLGSDGNLSDVANWADEAVHTDEFRWSMPLHFTNVQDTECDHGESGYVNCTFKFDRDCVDRDGKNLGFCNAGAILNYSQQLREGVQARRLDDSIRTALKFVVHFIGDIHQPLHCGLLADRGGVEINVLYPVNAQGEHFNLHNVWDFGLIVNHEGVEGQRGPMINSISSLLQSTWQDQLKSWQSQGDPKQWVQESLDQATRYAYRFPNGTAIRHTHGRKDEVRLQPALLPYIQDGGVIDLQLARGAVRLATLLNDIFATGHLVV